MRIWTMIWLLVVAATGTFVVANGQVLMAQTAISLIVAEVTAPLGLVMLGAMAVLALLCLIFVVWLETRALLQVGRLGRSTTGEPGRDVLTALQAHLDRQFGDLKSQTSASTDNLFSRLDHVEQVVRDLAQTVGHRDVA